ncbi:MAG: ferredoxin-thioredoxin reductase catalytic domain-containing protein [Candidatus Lokiarchaeota archaeon]
MNLNSKKGMLEYCRTVSEKNDWILQKDEQTLNDLLEGLVENKKRYGYQSCPCRMASGKRQLDRDIICPCNYALNNDVQEYGSCYCNLFMKKNFYEGHNPGDFTQVPENRSIEKERATLDYINEQLK